MASRDEEADVRSALALAPSARSVVEKLGELALDQDGAKASIQFAKHRGRWIAEFRFVIRSGSHQACTLPLTTSSERFDTRAAALAGAASRLLESLQSAIEGERLAKAGQKAVAALRAWAGQFLAAEPAAQPASGPLSGMRFLDVFAGIGGFHQALASLGASCAGAIELDAKARETYKANHRGDYPVHADIREVDAGAFGKVHIVCGGFPCQSFSVAGKRAGFADPDKGALFFDLARLLGALSPSIAILENVAGLANHDGGRTLEIVFDTLASLGYSVSMRTLNSGSFGTPQMRERLFLVCIHDRALANRTTPFVFPKGADVASVVADILEPNPQATSCGRAWSRTKPDPAARSGKIEAVGLIEGKKGQGYRIASPLGKGFTLCANSGGAGRKTGLYLVDGKPRVLTPREAARMQGFPETFAPHANRNAALRQFGNSVAVPVVEAIAKALTFKRSVPRGPRMGGARKQAGPPPRSPIELAGATASPAECATPAKSKDAPKRKAASKMKACASTSKGIGAPNYALWIKGFSKIRNEPSAAFQKINLCCESRCKIGHRSFSQRRDGTSMIESLSIANTATYGLAPQVLDRLGRFNFLFGTNGAGKTTITKVIANPGAHPHCAVAWKKGTALEPMVYNRDFVERNFTAAPRLKGIFTLGEQDIANLEAIAAKKIELDTISKTIEQLTNTLQGQDQKSGKKGELVELDTHFKNKCWDQKQKHDDAFKDAFTGARGSSEKFKDRVLEEQASNNAELKTLAYLADKAKTVFGTTPVSEAVVPGLGPVDIAGHEANPILAKKVIGKEDVDIAELIQRLGNSDWVKQGQTFYERSKPTCPFCQQKLRDSFEASLADYFDETFAKDTKAIVDLQAAYARDDEALRVKLKAVVDGGSRFMDMEAFEAERSAIEARLGTNALLLANKAKEPSLPVQLEQMSELLAAASKLIAAANEAVSAHNLIAKNITKERTDLTKQVWKHILEAELKAELATYASKRAGLNAAITKLGGQIQDANTAKTAKPKEIKELEKSATSIEPTIDGINSLLKSFGFRNFTIAKADDGPFYKMVRADGSDAKDSLSEGERSFVTFLYFFHLLKGSESESGMTADRVVVFDDPVSSMDSDVLFIVSSLIKSLFDPVRKGTGGIKQIFVLTHNVYFHKEVTYTSDRGDDAKGGERSYWTVRKGLGGATVQHHPSNPIKTSYDLLWAELRRPEKSALTVQNTMRRILENYFKILGRIDFDEICDQFEGQQKVMCRSLLAWVNDGSHFSHDATFYTLDQAAIAVYVEIFKQIFVKAKQEAHYDMMMAGPQ